MRPAARSTSPVGWLGLQVCAQDVGEQVVVAVPAPLVVEGHHEQVLPFQRLDHRPAARCPGDGVAQGRSEPVQDGGGEQEVADLVGLVVEDLLDEVVHDVAVVAGEPRDERRRVLAAPQRDGRQLQRGDPALGAGSQGGDVGRVQVEPGRVTEVMGRLLVGEPQVGRADLRQLAARPQPGQRQRRVGAGADDQAHLGRQSLEQERHARLDLRALGEVVVVEQQVHVVGQHAELVEDVGQDGLDRLVGAEEGEAGCTGTGCGALQSGEHVGPERRRLAVGLVERHPGEPPVRAVRRALPGQPGGEQRRLAEARRSRDEGQPGPPGAEDLVQAWPGHESVASVRTEELGLDQDVRHQGSLPRSAVRA